MPNRKQIKKTSSRPAAKKPASGAKKIKSSESRRAKAQKPASRKPSVKKPAPRKSAKAAPSQTPKAKAATAAVPAAPEKKPKKPLTQRDKMLLTIRAQLMQQKDMLLSEAETALNELPGQTIFPDLGDQASAEIDRDFLLRLRGREQRLLKKIDDAVDRIDNGTFGICEDCGNEIDIKRLLARPVTTMCIECKTLQEEEERRRES